MLGKEIGAYWLYQISNIAILIFMFFLRVKVESSWLFYLGLIFYILGLLFYTVSVVNFARPSNEGLNDKGLYCFSRNPMYLSYFIFFSGCSLLTQSLVLCGIVLIFQFTAHGVILSEERGCIEMFGEKYKQYMKKVRRYFWAKQMKQRLVGEQSLCLFCKFFDQSVREYGVLKIKHP